MNSRHWAIVLAGGQGSRLRSLTADERGIPIPKQFCSLRGGCSLLREALRRAQAAAPRAQICTVVAAQHDHWWSRDLCDLPDANVIVQPANRGTANGILLPLLHIGARDAGALLAVLPSDHHVQDEAALALALRAAMQQIELERGHVLLLGISPDEADPELGYIVPGADTGRRLHAVESFVEKPAAPIARQLVRDGALWNSFVLVAHAGTLLQFIERKIPAIVAGMRACLRQDGYQPNGGAALRAFYADLPSIDFSRQILHGSEPLLRVVRVPACGWSDLGTPRRLAATLRRLPADRDPQAAHSQPLPGLLSLAVQQARLGAAAP
ncbi:MAG TPA: sugar phosphate nucleotidyltransferase [Steroidobacteraceae bacterium]|nr:sugar phosphate nucleotidyltransferase [Steroidobacteraceae bacterium]